MTAFPLFLHSLTSLISNSLSLLFGTQGRPRRLKPFSANKNRGHRGPFVPRRALQGPAQFQLDKKLFSHSSDKCSVFPCSTSALHQASWLLHSPPSLLCLCCVSVATTINSLLRPPSFQALQSVGYPIIRRGVGEKKNFPSILAEFCGWTNNKIGTRQINRRKRNTS